MDKNRRNKAYFFRTSLYFLVLLGTSSYFLVLLGTSSYFSVLLGTSRYFLVLLSTSWYFSVLLRTFVLQKYRSPLVPPWLEFFEANLLKVENLLFKPSIKTVVVWLVWPKGDNIILF